MWAKHFNISGSELGEFATCLAIWRAIVSGQLVLIGGNLVDISSTVSVRSYDVNASVQRFSIAGVPVASQVLEAAWNAIEDPT